MVTEPTTSYFENHRQGRHFRCHYGTGRSEDITQYEGFKKRSVEDKQIMVDLPSQEIETHCSSVAAKHESQHTTDKQRGCCNIKQSQAGRVLRNRRYRRPFDDHRHTKRLFTPEIKRFLKGWLVRRRENPYPNRDEKKELAVQTGLTYIQICNWFANWRRKLKNASKEMQLVTWGNLIKSYNNHAQGNVEQFSICSDDSIWEEHEILDGDQETEDNRPTSPLSLTFAANTTAMDHCYSAVPTCQESEAAQTIDTNNEVQTTNNTLENKGSTTAGAFVSFQPENLTNTQTTLDPSPNCSNKYKTHIMKKYLRDISLAEDSSDHLQRSKFEPVTKAKRKRHRDHLDEDHTASKQSYPNMSKPGKKQKRSEEPSAPVLSKWLESAARFQPSQSYITWAAKNVTWKSSAHDNRKHQWDDPENMGTHICDVGGYWIASGHQREELDAAEALTRLSGIH